MLNELIELFKGIDWPSLVFGAILGAIIPALGKWIISLFKKREETYHLSLIRGEASNYSSMSEGDVSVSIRYKDEDYIGVLSVLEIGFENDGLNAISFANHFDKPIIIRSDTYKIVDVQNISEDRIKTNVSLSDGVVQVSWGLLKKGERIVVRLVGECIKCEDGNTKERCTFYDSLSFSVRSDCVDYIAPRRVTFKYLALVSFVACLLFGVVHYLSIDKKDYREEVYSFNIEGESLSGHLEYDDDTNVYTLSQSDSLKPPYRLFDLNRYPRITVYRAVNQRTFIILLYFGMWLLFLLLSAFIVASEKKHDNRKVFED